MYLADYHTHTSCSPDGSATMAELTKKAVEVGLDEICFTDHMDPIHWMTLARRDSFPWDEALRQFEEAKRLYGDRITLKLGAEAGEAYMDLPMANKLQDDAPDLDFVIGSVHYGFNETKGGYEDLYFLPAGDTNYYHKVIDRYLDEVVKLVDWGRFSVLGHLTLPLRYINENYYAGLTFAPFYDRVDEIFRRLIDKGLGIECNTNRGNEPLPGEDLLRRYRALGGEIITLGTDSHSPQHIGCAIREKQQLLRECGFTHFTTFTQRKPIFHKL